MCSKFFPYSKAIESLYSENFTKFSDCRSLGSSTGSPRRFASLFVRSTVCGKYLYIFAVRGFRYKIHQFDRIFHKFCYFTSSTIRKFIFIAKNLSLTLNFILLNIVDNFAVFI